MLIGNHLKPVGQHLVACLPRDPLALPVVEPVDSVVGEGRALHVSVGAVHVLQLVLRNRGPRAGSCRPDVGLVVAVLGLQLVKQAIFLVRAERDVRRRHGSAGGPAAAAGTGA